LPTRFSSSVVREFRVRSRRRIDLPPADWYRDALDSENRTLRRQRRKTRGTRNDTLPC
jgi:hypothetical protein